MATIEQIKLDGPVTLIPAQNDFEFSAYLVRGVQPIALNNEEAGVFLRWVKENWQAEFERDLYDQRQQKANEGGSALVRWLKEVWASGDKRPRPALNHEADNDSLLTSSLPLGAFRGASAAPQGADSDAALEKLMNKIQSEMRHWQGISVDTVVISGVAT